MKLAVISDLHSDIVSLDAALARIRAMGCDQIVCAGDLVDGDVFPDEVIARLAGEEIPTIRGNHDRWALEHVGELRRAGRRPEDLRAIAQSDIYDVGDGSLGSGQELSDSSIQWLRRLPTSLNLELEGVRIAIHHARPGLWGYDMVGIDPRTTTPSQMTTMLESARADVLLVGHTHEPFYRDVPGGMVANPGALWNARLEFSTGGPLQGSFGVLELPAKRFTVYRVADSEVLLDSAASHAEGKRP